MTSAEADRIRREGPRVVVERLDGVARFSYEAILTEQQEARLELLASGPIVRPLTARQRGLIDSITDLVAEEILSFGERERRVPEPNASVGGSAATRARERNNKIEGNK